MVPAVSRQPLTDEARLRARASPCGICGGQSGTVAGFSQRSSVLSCQYHSTVALNTHASPGEWTIGQVVAAVQRHCLNPSTWTTLTIYRPKHYCMFHSYIMNEYYNRKFWKSARKWEINIKIDLKEMGEQLEVNSARSRKGSTVNSFYVTMEFDQLTERLSYSLRRHWRTERAAKEKVMIYVKPK
jgi:hypothetical protein